MANTYVLDQIRIAGTMVNLLTNSNGDRVSVTYASANKTLNEALSSIYTSITSLPTSDGVDTKISTAINNLIGGAPATYDTLKEIADYISEHEEVATALNTAIGNKVDKVTGKGLSTNDFTDALLSKLNAITANATKVESSTTNGKIKINGTETTVYTHPTATAKTAALVKVGNDASGHVVLGSAVSKNDITALGIPAQDTTYSNATTSTAGLMSATDKAALDGFRGVRYGTTVPTDMKDGELFVKVLS